LSRVGYIKTSLIDFPGRVASVLFLPGCDFRCPYCHNAALVDPGWDVQVEGDGGLSGSARLDGFFEFLDRRKHLVSGVVLSGGEPLLDRDTPRIARSIHGRGLAVKLDTNGSFPARIADVAADYVALDFKTAPAAYGRVAPGMRSAGDCFLESLAYLRSSGTPFEIRVTCAPGVVGLPEFEAMALELEKGDEVLLQDFRPGGCLDPAWDSVEPYPRMVMEAFLAIVRRRAPQARIRGG
jgi:pyruvate formate lyase activating enzyme